MNITIASFAARKLVLIAVILCLLRTEAKAQMGIGLDGWSGSPFMFYDIGGPSLASELTYDLHQRSQTRSAQVASEIQDNWNAGNAVQGHSYLDNLRGTTPYELATRQTPQPRSAPVSTSRRPTVAKVAVPAPFVPSFSSFLQKDGRLDWPLDSPASGELARLRSEADQSLLTVSQEIQRNGRASLTTITSARAKLITYGQGALQQVRTERSDQIANGFHAFLMAVHNSVEGTEKGR